jgi:hypothetical protein
VGEDAIAPVAEGPRWGWRDLLANTTITVGINNIFDMAPPLSVDSVSGFPSNFDNASGVNYFQGFLFRRSPGWAN